jgi:hypothetical protein
MLAENKKLPDAAFGFLSGMDVIINQTKARKHTAAPDEPRYPVRATPIVIQRVLLEPSQGIEIAPCSSGPELGEIVRVELQKILQSRLLFWQSSDELH